MIWRLGRWPEGEDEKVPNYPIKGDSGLPLVLDPAPADDRERVGVEHEYRLWNHAEQTDFRVLLPLVAGDLRCLDPGDPRARRLPSGVALTADGLEAELATPPVRVGPGVGRTLDLMLARSGRSWRPRRGSTPSRP